MVQHAATVDVVEGAEVEGDEVEQRALHKTRVVELAGFGPCLSNLEGCL